MTALQLTYNGVALHDLGDVTILSQSSTFSPDEFPQKETRTLSVRIETWERETGFNYDTLYANMQAVRAALAVQNKVLKWQSPGASAAGNTLLERPVMVVGHDLPEDPNSWGIYNQTINLQFRFDLDTSAGSTTLIATVLGTGITPSAINLGRVSGWKDEYRNQFYSEWRNFRQRSSGSVTVTGELFRGLSETGNPTDNRVAQLLADKELLTVQLQQGAYINLKYGPESARFFDRDCKVEAFNADIDQGPTQGVIRYSMTVSFTVFPDEDGYAAADFTSALGVDNETGEETLGVSGRVMAATEALALSKLGSLVGGVLTAYGYAATNQQREEITKSWVNAHDTSNANAFIELTFNYTYRKKKEDELSYTLTVSDVDDLKSGLLTTTYSGTVTAGSSGGEEAAYQVAIAKARLLGDKKHVFRVSASETRADRQMLRPIANPDSPEFVRVEFSYVYQRKGSRIYLELTTSTSEETFGESSVRVNGYVVAAGVGAAETAYLDIARNPAVKEGYIVRNETLDSRQERVQTGSPWFGDTESSSTTLMWTRLDFSLSLFKPKASGYAMKYGVKVSIDFLNLLQNTTVDGTFAAPVGEYNKLEAANGSSVLEAMLATAPFSGYGSLIRKTFDYDKEKVAAGSPQTIIARFSLEYQKKANTTVQILASSFREEITYSGTRWVYQQRPDGADIPQDCGLTQATRTVSGSVTAATETAARTWVGVQYASGGLCRVRNADDDPETEDPNEADAYEEPLQLSTSWEMVPLTNDKARGGAAANLQVCRMDFTFRETIPNLPNPFGP